MNYPIVATLLSSYFTVATFTVQTYLPSGFKIFKKSKVHVVNFWQGNSIDHEKMLLKHIKQEYIYTLILYLCWL